MTRFAHFVAIDWSGAVGAEHRGIAIAICGHGRAVPALVPPPGRYWSRAAVLDWLEHALPDDSLVGFDLGPALPFVDRGAYFPGWPESPRDAHSLWALVERLCAADPHLAATSFVDHPDAALHFRRHGGREGASFGGGRGRLRATEVAQHRQGLNPYSNFNLVGAAQVGKSSLTGMRLLRRLGGRLPVWPFDPLPPVGSAVVEIYTSLAALAAGRARGRAKMRDIAALNLALASPAIDSDPMPGSGTIDDHASDAILTAAWMRRHAGCAGLWTPAGLSPIIARTEGWTFGVT